MRVAAGSGLRPSAIWQLPGTAVVQGIRLEPSRLKRRLRRLRHPASAARQQDGRSSATTGRPTPRRRSSGACPTSRAATEPRAMRGPPSRTRGGTSPEAVEPAEACSWARRRSAVRIASPRTVPVTTPSTIAVRSPRATTASTSFRASRFPSPARKRPKATVGPPGPAPACAATASASWSSAAACACDAPTELGHALGDLAPCREPLWCRAIPRVIVSRSSSGRRPAGRGRSMAGSSMA